MQWRKVKLISAEYYKVFTVNTTEFSRGQHNGIFYQIKAPDWVNVICEIKQQIMMIRQFRIGIEDYVLELPGGLIDSHEPALAAGVRELAEETGFSGDAQVIGTMFPNPALFTNQLHTVLVTDARKTNEISREIFEDIEIVLVPMHELKQKIAHGEITNALTLASLMQYFSLNV
ncbi:NUDIX hydrolase [Macrococcus capreoli]|uniref:NUDIX hydrolase n=1 Tax=Macrococcus capreoli TaxID=2982690 RepID=UPI003EE6B73A